MMAETTEKKTISEKLVSVFEEHRNEIFAGSSETTNRYRQNAIEHFRKTGLPNKKNEGYKYSDVRKIFEEKELLQHFSRKEYSFSLEEVFKCDVPNLDTHTILLINGWYPYTDNPIQDLGGGILAGSFEHASVTHKDIFEKYYNKASDTGCALQSLNTAFAKDGIFLYVPKNAILEKPLQIINLLVEDEPLLVHPRNLMVFEENSEASIVICDHTLSAQKFLTNSVSEIFLEKGAKVDFCKMQNEHNLAVQIASTHVKQAEKSIFTSNTLSLHGGFIRNNLTVDLAGEYCESNLYGIYLADKHQHIDNYTHVDHAVPNCTSHELYKGIVDDLAVTSFSGRVLVREDAQNTNAFQSNNNLLLSNDAQIYTKPQLEIYADDVKCSHGATIGQIDQAALFYLKARGIGQKEAMTMLMFAFAFEVIGKISVEALREKMSNLVDKRLRGEFSRCNHCIIRCC